MAFVSSDKIYVKIENIGVQSCNNGIVRECLAIFATLIESEEDGFVENNDFSKSLTRFLTQITEAKSLQLDLDTNVEIVELSFNITTKIRLNPPILPTWFWPPPRLENLETVIDASEKFAGKTNKEDFPIFYILIDYIHQEGRLGDFARTGLLYIIEAISTSGALEQWIIESDLATRMATGLGALYSQLSRKLVIDYPDAELAPALALSDYQHPTTTLEIVSSSSPDFKMKMDTFLSHLVFWQDVLNHCESIEVKQTLLEHFHVIFLQQILYPSLLESSDVDGGSSVAVLTYLKKILESVDHPDMIHLILHYLLALPDSVLCPTRTPGSISAARQRKSIDLATMMASQNETNPTPALFNLVDLIHGSLTSLSKETISVTLNLISVILKRHHRYALSTLFRTSQILSGGPPRTVGAQNAVMNFFLGLAGEIGGDFNLLDEIYDNHIHDCRNVLESHSCSARIISPNTSEKFYKFSSSHSIIPGTPNDMRPHTLRPDDPMLQIMVGMLTTFLINSVETNLSLTAVIFDLATCGYMRIDGWLLPDPSKYIYEEDNNQSRASLRSGSLDFDGAAEEVHYRSLKLARRVPNWAESEAPALLKELKKIIEQINVYKTEIPRFDELLQKRREAFQTASSTFSTLSTLKFRYTELPQPSIDTNLDLLPRQNTFDSIAQRFFPDRNMTSRPESPRVRKNQDRTIKSFGSGISASTILRSSTPPRPLENHDMLSTEEHRQPSSNPVERKKDKFRHDDLPSNEDIPFGAVDQSILAKKVCLPSIGRKSTSDAIPNSNDEKENFNKKCGDDENVDCCYADVTGEASENEILVSVNHLLTNVIIVQEFLFELAALVQVRASFFGEVSYV